SPSTVPGLRVQFDPMPDETTDRLVQLLKDLGLSMGAPGAQWSLPGELPTVPAVPPPEPKTMPAAAAGAPAPAPAPPPDAQITAPHAVWSTPPPRPLAAGVAPATTPSAPFGPPFLPADMQQITWAPQDDSMVETRTMSMEAVQSALEAAELTPPGGKVPIPETAQAALSPPPIMPVPSTTPPPTPRG